MRDDFKVKLKQRQVLVGTLITLGSTEVAEILASIGFDWLWIDMEHAPLDLARAQELIQAVGDRCATLVRVPWNDTVWIKRVLDLGCDGIVVPQIKSAAEARDAVRACRYPPDGVRSVGVARAQGYGARLADYLRSANDRLSVVLQIEHVDALDRIHEILDVPGVDAVFVGPLDLSASLGHLGDVGHADVQAAIAVIKGACSARGTPMGVFAIDARSAMAQVGDGSTLIAMGTDTMYLHGGAKAAIEALQRR
jgi:2-dehydro-3-deoxyglucarate aldolase/4-hydroxy-2-oxoheptanedioate aldolase